MEKKLPQSNHKMVLVYLDESGKFNRRHPSIKEEWKLKKWALLN
jgi:hypothetical protein